MGRPIEGNGDPLACASALEYYAVSICARSCPLVAELTMHHDAGSCAECLWTYLTAQPGSAQYDP